MSKKVNDKMTPTHDEILELTYTPHMSFRQFASALAMSALLKLGYTTGVQRLAVVHADQLIKELEE